MKDPRHTELLQTPYVAFDKWEHGIVWDGDCDDYTILLTSLLSSIGYNVGFRAASYTPNKVLGHVYGLVQIYGDWIPIDGIKEGGFVGWEKDGITATKQIII